ncbi:hypothetical protein EDC04DRAFT_945570 [Pisolithus marmoratus]|nr:hypothetical protein EDC04DRAFT_945570 [Pisolithus marmoratus]
MHHRAHPDTRSVTFKKDCPLDHSYRAAAPGYNGFASIDRRESQCLTSSAGEVCDVSVSELPAPLPVPDSSLVGHLNREHDGAQVALPSVYSANEVGALPIAYEYWDKQDHASNRVTNHNTTGSSSYTSIAIGRLWTYPQEIGNVSTFGDLDYGAAIPTMGLGPVCPFHGYTPGQVTDSNAVWPELSSSLLPSRQQPRVSDDHISNNILLPSEQIRTEMAAPTQFLSSFTTQQINQTHFPTPFPYTYPDPSQSNSTSDDHVSFDPSLMSNYIPSSQSPQEHPGYPLVHPHHTIPACLSGFHGFRAGNKVDLHTTSTVDNHTAHVLNDHLLPTPSDHGAPPFGDHATYILSDHTARMTFVGVDDYGNTDKSKSNSEEAVGSRPQSSLPANQLLLSPREFHSHDHVSRTGGGSLSGTFRHAHRFARPQSRALTRPPKARSVCDGNMYILCEWRDDNDQKCGMRIEYGDCANHFAAIHNIKNITWNVILICRWCPPKEQKKVLRKNLLRHLREVHFHCVRSVKGTWR